MVGAGVVVTRDVPANAIVTGNPASIVGYVFTEKPKSLARGKLTAPKTAELGVVGARLCELPLVDDMRGNLPVAELGKGLPFVPKRCFSVFDVPSKEIRGEHAHKTFDQFLICMCRQVNVVVDDGRLRAEVCLDRPDLGSHVSPRVWGAQYKYSPDAMLAVRASDRYDTDDYIRNYDEFIEYVAKGR